MQYAKIALTFEEQLTLLQERGLQVLDRERAMRWLSKVSYYRLSAYFLPFKDGERFRPDVEFNDIAGLYIFDRKLRLLVLDAIERIEVAVRTVITYEIGHTYGPFGHTSADNFSATFDHARFMTELEEEEGRSKETFVAHFRRKYDEEEYLPVWMATELASLGTMSQLYQALTPDIKRRIADPYNTNAEFLASWLHALNYIRNVCAHHKRLWNRRLAIRPRIPSRSLNWRHNVSDNEKLYAVLVVVCHMLDVVSPRCNWKARLFELFDAHPGVPLEPMGIPGDWRGRNTWR
jgi:abortive infection bacteriophage resistance protein